MTWPTTPKWSPSPSSTPSAFQVVFDETMERARKVLGHDASIHDCIEAMLAEASWPGIGGDGAAAETARAGSRHREPPTRPVPVRPEAIAHAKQTLARVAEYVEDVEQIDAVEEPQTPEEALLVLRQIQLLRAPGRVLFAHLIRDLRRVRAMELLGYRSMARMVEDLLKISERSARNRVAESLLFESDAAIEEAFGRGEISTMQAHLIRRLGTADGCGGVHRAGARGDLAAVSAGVPAAGAHAQVRPGEACPAAAVAGADRGSARRGLGGDREAIEEALRIRGIPPLPPGGSSDPAENPVLMDRLETMVELLALRQWEEVPGDRRGGPANVCRVAGGDLDALPAPEADIHRSEACLVGIPGRGTHREAPGPDPADA